MRRGVVRLAARSLLLLAAAAGLGDGGVAHGAVIEHGVHAGASWPLPSRGAPAWRRPAKRAGAAARRWLRTRFPGRLGVSLEPRACRKTAQGAQGIMYASEPAVDFVASSFPVAGLFSPLGAQPTGAPCPYLARNGQLGGAVRLTRARAARLGWGLGVALFRVDKG